MTTSSHSLLVIPCLLAIVADDTGGHFLLLLLLNLILFLFLFLIGSFTAMSYLVISLQNFRN